MTTTNRSFVMASEGLFRDFHEERKAIARRYPALSDEPSEWDTLAMMRRVAMDELRETVKLRIRLGFDDGPYLIPV